MRTKSTTVAAIFALAAAGAPALVQGLDLSFLDQAPIRFFNDADLKLMGEAADKALDSAKDGEDVDWRNEQTGNSGTITPTRSFSRQGNDCRQLGVVSRAEKATGGSTGTNLDFCKVEDTWKILRIAR